MQTVRLYDAARQPPGWLQIIRPTQFAVFATQADSGASCDVDGVPTGEDDASCAIFDTLDDAEAFCRARVDQNPHLRFDIRDSGGLLRPPLFTIVHPSRVEELDGSTSKMRWNTYLAIALFIAGPLLIWWEWTYRDGRLILPTIVGVNAPLIGIRLLVMNYGSVAKERARRERVERARRPFE
jgi:hypothetical protein